MRFCVVYERVDNYVVFLLFVYFIIFINRLISNGFGNVGFINHVLLTLYYNIIFSIRVFCFCLFQLLLRLFVVVVFYLYLLFFAISRLLQYNVIHIHIPKLYYIYTNIRVHKWGN